MSTAIHSPGDVLGDRYVLRKNEWRSPIGPVWVARDRVLDRPVLAQLLAPETAGNQAAVRAFQKHAAKVAQITHPAILRVFDIGEEPPFVVFEHAAGGRLVDRLRSGPIPHTDAARAALSLARGLETLHQRGVAHGSLSPGTVLLDAEGRAKIYPGAATAVAAAAPGVVQASAEQPKGYAPPERAPLPADADRYALAALLFHMVTGAPPERPGSSARAMRRSVPGPIDDLLRRALSADPGTRPSLDTFEGALGPFVRVDLPPIRTPRFSGSEFRWLLPVLLIVGLAVGAATFGVQLARDLAERLTRAAPTTTPPPREARALAVRDVSDFDPPPGNGSERPEDAPLAIDRDPLTAWETVGYATARLDGRKSGVGLLFDLGDRAGFARVRVRSTRPGWKAEIRIADAPAEGADGYRRVTTFTAGADTTVGVPPGTAGRYVLLWITSLVDDGGGSEFRFRAAVAEVEFLGS